MSCSSIGEFGLMKPVSSKIFQSDNAASYPRRNGVSAGSSLKPSFRHLSRWAIISVVDLKLFSRVGGAVAGLVGIECGVVSGVINLESSGVEASDWRPRHDEH